MMRLIFAAAVLIALAGCDRGGEGTSISINANKTDGNGNGNGNGSVGVDGATGAVSIDVPGFEGTFKLPKIQLDAGDFDLNGVPLYPGSTIRSVNVDPRGRGKEGLVRVAFDSPADPARVRAYFQQRLAKAGFTVRADGNGLAGETDEKRPFRLQFDPSAEGRAQGTITVG
jgi:hypothetical protein